MTTEKLDNLIASVSGVQNQIKELKQQEAQIMDMIAALIANDAQEQLKKSDYGCGTATVLSEKHKIKYVVSKDVKWDQDELEVLFEKIKASNENPKEYIKVKFDVAESAYKAWPSAIKEAFEPARSVAQSKPKITFEEKKG